MAFDVSERFVGLVNIPINEILCYPNLFKIQSDLPCLCRDDWTKIAKLAGTASIPCVSGFGGMSIHCDSRDVILESTKSISCARSLSFYPWLSSRLYEEAKFFCGLGIRTVLFDCSGHPRPNELCREPALYWIIRLISNELRSECNSNDGIKIGLRIAGCADWAMDIACRAMFDFVVVDINDNESMYESRFGWLMRRMHQLTDCIETGNIPILYLGADQCLFKSAMRSFDYSCMDGIYVSFDADKNNCNRFDAVSEMQNKMNCDMMFTSDGDATNDDRLGIEKNVISDQFRVGKESYGVIDHKAVLDYIEDFRLKR